jgi:Flp pilus assembly protein TadD
MTQEENNDAGAYCNSGYAKYCCKNYLGAVDDFTKAIELKPYCASAYNNRGAVYNVLGQKNKAQTDFAKAKELGYSVNPK